MEMIWFLVILVPFSCIGLVSGWRVICLYRSCKLHEINPLITWWGRAEFIIDLSPGSYWKIQKTIFASHCSYLSICFYRSIDITVGRDLFPIKDASHRRKISSISVNISRFQMNSCINSARWRECASQYISYQNNLGVIGPTTNMEMSEVVHKYVRKANKMNIQILRDFFFSGLSNMDEKGNKL